MDSKPQRAELLAEIINTVVDAVNLRHVDRSTIVEDTPLTQGGLELDSVDILEIVINIEHRFGVKVGNAEAGKMHFRTIGTITDFVSSTAH